jgi:hypothetical protein
MAKLCFQRNNEEKLVFKTKISLVSVCSLANKEQIDGHVEGIKVEKIV